MDCQSSACDVKCYKLMFKCGITLEVEAAIIKMCKTLMSMIEDTSDDMELIPIPVITAETWSSIAAPYFKHYLQAHTSNEQCKDGNSCIFTAVPDRNLKIMLNLCNYLNVQTPIYDIFRHKLKDLLTGLFMKDTRHRLNLKNTFTREAYEKATKYLRTLSLQIPQNDCTCHLCAFVDSDELPPAKKRKKE